MSKEILLAWQGYSEKSTGTFVDIEERTVIYLDTKPLWAKMEKDIEAYKNRIRVLENLNKKYREELGKSNEPIDAINAVNGCTQENIYERERFRAIDFAKWFSDFNGLTWEEKRVSKERLNNFYEDYLKTLGGGI